MATVTAAYLTLNTTYNVTPEMDFNGTNDEDIYHGPPTPLTLFYIWSVNFCIITFNIPVFFILPKVKSLPDTSRIVMLSLATTDLCLGLIMCFRMSYFAIDGEYYLEDSSFRCKFDAAANTMFAGVSVFHLTFVLLDRLILVTKPLHYSQIMTKTTIYCILFFLWVLGLIFALLLFFQVGNTRVKFYDAAYFCLFDSANCVVYASFVLIFFMFVPLILIGFAFTGLYLTARKQVRAIGAQESRTAGSYDMEKNRKIIRTLSFMIIGFYVFWTPFFLFLSMWEMIYGEVNETVELLVTYLAGGNSFINPLIYIPTIKEYRYLLLRRLRKLKVITLRKWGKTIAEPTVTCVEKSFSQDNS